MKHNSKSAPAANSARTVAFWKRHREDTMAVIHGRIKPDVFRSRYGYLPLLVQRALDRGDRRFTRRSR